MPRMTRKRTIWTALVMVLIFIGATAEGCTGDSSKPATSERKVQQTSYQAITARQPAHGMTYSPTRTTINAWIDHWGKDPNKLSYVYLQNAEGKMIGYYVFQGLPVSMCTALTPTWQYEYRDLGSDHGDMQVPAPGVDAVYYSGGECQTKYGVDATSHSMVQYSVGFGINELIYEEPLPQSGDVPALGKTRVAPGK